MSASNNGGNQSTSNRGKPLLKWRLVARLLDLGQVRSPEEVVAILADRR